MNLLDAVLTLGLLVTAVRGAQRGALFQIGAIAGVGAGLLGGAWAAPRGASAFVDGPGVTLALATLGLLALCLLIGQMLGTALGLRLREAVEGAGAGGADRAAGVAVGAAGLIAAVWVLAAAFAQGPSAAVAEQIRTSRVVTTLDEALPAAPDVFSRVGAYLDRQGFPQVFSGVAGGATAPPVDPPQGAAVEAAADAAARSTVQVAVAGCGGLSFGSGFVPATGHVVTNAHVIAGGSAVSVRDQAGTYAAEPILFDPDADLAVLSVPDLQAPAIAWADQAAERGTEGAVLGFPGGQRELDIIPAAVRGRVQAVGRDIYGTGSVTREVLLLSAEVRQGDSGGPFVTAAGDVAGVTFAAAMGEPGVGYALSAASVRQAVAQAIDDGAGVTTGACRF